MMSTGVLEDPEFIWEQLLRRIEKGQIVPVIGPELTTVEIDGSDIPLVDWLVPRLHAALKLSGDVPKTLSEVAYRYIPASQNKDYIYWQASRILQEARFEIPETLRILARIRPLRTFVTTTVDDLLEAALLAERKVVSSYVHAPISMEDDEDRMDFDRPQPSADAVVFHLFGKAGKSPRFVVTEEDLLEFSHHWMKESQRFAWLKEVLKKQETRFMILGCGFENWMARFFLYGLRADITQSGAESNGLVADHMTIADPGLSAFLQRCRLRSEGSAIDFVRELGRRWEERHPTTVDTAKQPTDEYSDSASMQDDRFIFISYAHEDLELAERVRDSLASLGISVWLDKPQLEPGDAYENVIMRKIKEAAFFIPIISRNTLTIGSRFFRKEWHQAIDELKCRPPGYPFILPVATRGTPVDHSYVPDSICNVHWTRIEQAEDISLFARQCQMRIRKLQRLTP